MPNVETKRRVVNPVSRLMRVVKRDGTTAVLGKLFRFVVARASTYKSQKGQDRWVLQTLGNKQGGFFVDLPAGPPALRNRATLLSRTLLCVLFDDPTLPMNT